MKPIVLIGGGGHCVSCIDVIERSGQYAVAGVLDLPEKAGQTVLGYPVLGCDDDLDDLARQALSFLVAIGQVKSAALRRSLFHRVLQAGGELPAVVSRLAYVSPHADVRSGTIIMHHAMVNAKASVDVNCIVNSCALVEHDARIEGHCHISTGAVVNGHCVIGEGCFLGSGSVVREGIRLAGGTVVGAGAVVSRSIHEAGVYVGCPARRMCPGE